MIDARAIGQELQDQFLERVRKSQEQFTAAVRMWAHVAENVRSQLPGLPAPADRLAALPAAMPSPKILVISAYDLAGQVLAAQRQLAEQAVRAATPAFLRDEIRGHLPGPSSAPAAVALPAAPEATARPDPARAASAGFAPAAPGPAATAAAQSAAPRAPASSATSPAATPAAAAARAAAGPRRRSTTAAKAAPAAKPGSARKTATAGRSTSAAKAAPAAQRNADSPASTTPAPGRARTGTAAEDDPARADPDKPGAPAHTRTAARTGHSRPAGAAAKRAAGSGGSKSGDSPRSGDSSK